MTHWQKRSKCVTALAEGKVGIKPCNAQVKPRQQSGSRIATIRRLLSIVLLRMGDTKRATGQR